MFFNRLTVASVASALLMLGSPASAAPANDNLISVRLMMACPGARHVIVKEDKITWTSPLLESKGVGTCLRRAYADVVMNPEVLSGAGCQNGRAILRGGKIILSC